MSAEPSMEDILSSIKRIIAEEGDAPARPRRQPVARPMPLPTVERSEDEVLELSDPMPSDTPPAPEEADHQPVAEPASAAEPILSAQIAERTRGALESLSRLMLKPEPPSDGTLEGLVREMLRPMLREWMDANLPAMVETMVAREIAKITGTQ